MHSFDLRKFDLNLLKVFDALERERGVTRAARRLGLGQPAVSHALARLRQLLDDELFVRGAAGMTPTTRAVELVEPVRRALTQIEVALQGRHSEDASETRQRFRIAMSDVVAAAIMPRLLAELARRAPNASLAIHAHDPSSAAHHLDDGEIDLSIGLHRTVAGWHNSETLYEEDFVCVFHPSQVRARRPISIKQFVSYSHVLVTFRGDDRGFVDAALEKAGRVRKVAVTSPYFLLAGYLLHRLPLIATLPRRYAELCHTMSDVHVSELPFASPQMTISMVWHRRSERNPASQLLRDVVRQAVRR